MSERENIDQAKLTAKIAEELHELLNDRSETCAEYQAAMTKLVHIGIAFLMAHREGEPAERYETVRANLDLNVTLYFQEVLKDPKFLHYLAAMQAQWTEEEDTTQPELTPIPPSTTTH